MSSAASNQQHHFHTEKTSEAATKKAHHNSHASSRRTASGGAKEKPPSVFLCKPRYVNSLPEPPFLLKMYNLELETSQYAKYRISSLESSYKPKFETGPALGILVDLVTPEEDQDYGKGEPLTEEEEEILAQTDNVQDVKKRRSVPAWMRRTGYDEFSLLRTSKNSAQQTNSPRNATEEQQRSFMESIQDEFEAAKQFPVHPDPRKRLLQPTQILPVFPDFENWPDKFVVLQFDSNPADDVENQDMQQVMEDVIENALTVAFTNQSGERFLSYYIPTKQTVESRRTQRVEETSEVNITEDYELLREYSFVTRPDEGNRSFVFQEDEQEVRYFPVTSKLYLYRRIRRQESSQPEHHTLLVHRRPFTEEESHDRNAVVSELCGESNNHVSENANTAEMIRQLEQDE